LKVLQFLPFVILTASYQFAEVNDMLSMPCLTQQVSVDGDLSEWKHLAWSDGVWDLDRVKSSQWYEPKRNRLTVHPGEDTSIIDLASQYYMAWDGRYLYLGAEVRDNHHDVSDAAHEPKRWYYKDAIAFFVEIPGDEMNERFGEGDHGFAFVIDEAYPDYGAWWRHGNDSVSYLEEPLEACQYEVKMNPWGEHEADYILEASIDLQAILGTVPLHQEDVSWKMMIVHCDPDGGEYGGHLLIHGQGDDDASWTAVKPERCHD
jgi:hypothetical protein